MKTKFIFTVYYIQSLRQQSLKIFDLAVYIFHNNNIFVDSQRDLFSLDFLFKFMISTTLKNVKVLLRSDLSQPTSVPLALN